MVIISCNHQCAILIGGAQSSIEADVFALVRRAKGEGFVIPEFPVEATQVVGAKALFNGIVVRETAIG